MPRKTPPQYFRDVFNQFVAGATEHVRATAEKKVDSWLARHGKGRGDIASILAQAAADDAAAQPPPPPSDPRDNAPHPYDDPRFTPVGLVDGVIAKYVCMSEHARIICAAVDCFHSRLHPVHDSAAHRPC